MPPWKGRGGAVLTRSLLTSALVCCLLFANALSAQKRTVKLMGWGDTTSIAKYAILEEAFEAANPDIDLFVEIIDGRSYVRKLPVMIASGTAPDIFESVLESANSFGSFASKGAYVDLGPLVKRDGVDLNDWFEPVIESCHYDDVLYNLPKKLNRPALVHINLDLFDAAGLPYPGKDWTWDEALEMARRMTHDFDGDGRVDQWGMSWPILQGHDAAIMRGWQWLRNGGRESNFDDPLYHESLQWMADLVHVHHVAPSLEETEGAGLPGYLLFTTGKVAIQSGGRWQTAIYKREIGDRFRWDTVWLPVADRSEPRRVSIGTEAWGIYRQSDRIEDAWKVLKWLAGPGGSSVLAGMGGAIPAVKSVAESPAFLDASPPSRTGNRLWVEAMVHAVRPPRDPRWAKIGLLSTQVLKLGWDGQRPFKELVAELKPRVDAILQEKPRSTPQSMWFVVLAGVLAIGAGVGWARRRSGGSAVSLREQLRNRQIRQEAVYGWLFVGPHVAGLFVFTIGAILVSGYLSLTEWDLFGTPVWVGFGNYQRLWEDEIFWKTLYNTIYYAGLRVPLSIAFSLMVAILMNLKIPGILWWRVIYFVPAVSSSVAIALIWRWIYSKDFGLLNAMLGWLGLPAMSWLSSETLAMPSMIIMSVWWSVGTNMVIYLAALQGVPDQLYEAAEIDGAGAWHRFWHVTFPMITPTTFFLLILGTIGSLQIFDIFYVMTQGGPNFATTSLVMYIFQNAFEYLEMGYASAVAWVLFAIIMLLSLVQLKFSQWVHYEGERE